MHASNANLTRLQFLRSLRMSCCYILISSRENLKHLGSNVALTIRQGLVVRRHCQKHALLLRGSGHLRWHVAVWSGGDLWWLVVAVWVLHSLAVERILAVIVVGLHWMVVALLMREDRKGWSLGVPRLVLLVWRWRCNNLLASLVHTPSNWWLRMASS